MEKITLATGPFLCPDCAENEHYVQPRCPNHEELLRLNHTGDRARCPRQIGPLIP